MSRHATGTFEVKLAPQSLAHPQADSALGRMSLDKVFSGDLQGTSEGEMLTAGSPAKGSAGYVAIERVSGTLDGRTGTFVLQHSGTMNRGALELSVRVVPDGHRRARWHRRHPGHPDRRWKAPLHVRLCTATGIGAPRRALSDECPGRSPHAAEGCQNPLR